MSSTMGDRLEAMRERLGLSYRAVHDRLTDESPQRAPKSHNTVRSWHLTGDAPAWYVERLVGWCSEDPGWALTGERGSASYRSALEEVFRVAATALSLGTRAIRPSAAKIAEIERELRQLPPAGPTEQPGQNGAEPEDDAGARGTGGG